MELLALQLQAKIGELFYYKLLIEFDVDFRIKRFVTSLRQDSIVNSRRGNYVVIATRYLIMACCLFSRADLLFIVFQNVRCK